MIFNDNEKILTTKELEQSEFMKYSILFIRNVIRDDNNNLIKCSVIAMDDNPLSGFSNNLPEGTMEVFLTNKGAVEAFGFLGLGWH